MGQWRRASSLAEPPPVLVRGGCADADMRLRSTLLPAAVSEASRNLLQPDCRSRDFRFTHLLSPKLLCPPEQRLPCASEHDAAIEHGNVLNPLLQERPMYGEIKKFRRDLGVGVIYAEDGRAYRFEQTAIRNRREDLEGHEVHFELGGLKARDIIVLAGSPWAAFGSIGL